MVDASAISRVPASLRIILATGLGLRAVVALTVGPEATVNRFVAAMRAQMPLRASTEHATVVQESVSAILDGLVPPAINVHPTLPPDTGRILIALYVNPAGMARIV